MHLCIDKMQYIFENVPVNLKCKYPIMPDITISTNGILKLRGKQTKLQAQIKLNLLYWKNWGMRLLLWSKLYFISLSKQTSSQMIGKQLEWVPYTKNVIEMTPQTTGQFLWPVICVRSWSILLPQIVFGILITTTFCTNSSIVFVKNVRVKRNSSN